MRRRWWNGVVLCCGMLVLPALGATLPQSTTPVEPTTRVTDRVRVNAPDICFDQLFFWTLPGKTNYCVGLRDWNHGHYRNGLEFLKLAAGWGNKSAQYTLGLIYFNGHHVAADRALGFAWLTLANQHHIDPRIERGTRAVAKWLTPAERKRADALYRKLLPTYGDKVATARAWHHLRHWQRSHPSRTSGGVDLVGKRSLAALAAGVATPIFTGIDFIICVKMNTFRELVREPAGSYFKGWMGTVDVGPLKAVPAPPTSGT